MVPETPQSPYVARKRNVRLWRKGPGNLTYAARLKHVGFGKSDPEKEDQEIALDLRFVFARKR